MLVFQDASTDIQLTYLGQHVNSRDLDLRSNIDLTVQGYQVYVSTRFDERNTIVPELGR